MRKRKKNSSWGASGRWAFATTALISLVVAGVDAKPQQKENSPAAIITGTVFQASGHLLPGAKVEVVRESEPGFKRATTSDALGDFVFRVPVGAALYRVTAAARGFEPAEKNVQVHQDEKVRTNLILNPLQADPQTKKPPA